jgi:hypothetical protein
VPGSVPTLAQATGNPGLATLERGLQGANPQAANAFAERAAANAEARAPALGRATGTAGDIGTYLVDEARTVVAEIIATVPVDALSGNTSLTRELEVTLQSELARVLEGSGLELARVRFVEFEAEVADDIRRGEGALALRKRRAELNHRIRELLTQEKLDEFRSGKELEDFLRQIELEMGMRDLIRDEEMQRLKDDVGHGLDVRLLTQRLELEEIEDDAERERRRRVLDEAIETAADLRGDDKAQHEHELDKDRAEHELRQKKAQDAADLLAQMKERKLQGNREILEMQREHEAALLEQRSAATTEALISIVGGSDAGEQLARLEELRVKQNMTPDQLLPIVAAEAPHLAEALTEKYRAEGLASEEVLRMATDRAEELKELHRETQDRTERFTQMVLQQMGQVAMTRAQGPPAPQTVVAGAGGLGPPVVIGGAAQGPPQQPAASAARTCGHCGASMDGGASFCPVCAKRID